MRRYNVIPTLLTGIITILQTPVTDTARCYNCANDFVVWNWRHFFLKRNYAISSSDNLCGESDYSPSLSRECYSSCFIFLLNGTDRETGLTQTLGVGKGCSEQWLSDEQYNQRSLGIYTQPSGIANYLSHDFDKYELHEYWCFCAGERCNTEDCLTQWRYHGYNNYQSGSMYHPTNTNRQWRRTGNSFFDFGNAGMSTSFITIPICVFMPFVSWLLT